MTVICTKPTTPESRKRHAEIFGDKLDRYCKECGRLPSFCECGVFGGLDRDTVDSLGAVSDAPCFRDLDDALNNGEIP